jgi:metallo-beta-lactamase family protein
LPNLVRQGFTGPIFCTPATRDLLEIMLADSAKIQAEEAAFAKHVDESSTGLLYTRKEVEQTLAQCEMVPYALAREAAPGIRFRFLDAGHLLGSAMIAVSCDVGGTTRTITFTGDLGRHALDFLHSPEALPPSDLIICESTYGARVHQSPISLTAHLHSAVKETLARDGKVLVPAFSLGRTQIVVHSLCQAMQEGKLPRVPLYVDSPLATEIVQVHRKHPGCLARGVVATISDDKTVRYICDWGESRDLTTRPGPYILVASGGMCEAGRILHHLEHNIDDPRNTVILVSYQAPGSLGRKLLERGPTVRLGRRRPWNKWANVVDLNGFSAHADRHDLLRQMRPLLDQQPSVRLVHGEWEQASALAAALRAEGFTDVDIPDRDDSICVA